MINDDVDADDRRRKPGEVRFGEETKPRVTTAEEGGRERGRGSWQLTATHPTNRTELTRNSTDRFSSRSSGAIAWQLFSFFAFQLHAWNDREKRMLTDEKKKSITRLSNKRVSFRWVPDPALRMARV